VHLYGLNDNVLLAGLKPHSEIPIWMCASDVIVLSSLNEGNPTVMFEALGCGKPFIGTRTGGIPDIINSDDYGLVVESGDADGLSRALEYSMTKRWDSKAIMDYSTNFTWENIAEGIGTILHRYLH
jgi:glycosyltransferase involved in cell wall biosynthesis